MNSLGDRLIPGTSLGLYYCPRYVTMVNIMADDAYLDMQLLYDLVEGDR